MILYIIIFLLAIFFSYFAFKESKVNISFLLLMVLTLCLPAAFRSYDVGIDVQLYVEPLWRDACLSNSWHQYQINATFDTEKGYLMLNYIISRFTTNIAWLFFIHQLILVASLTFIISKCRKYNPLSFLLIGIYCFYYYCTSLSMFRMSVAIALCFFLSYFLFTGKYKWFIVGALFTSIFHNSAVLVLLLLPIKLIIDRFKNKQTLLLVLVLASGVVLYASFFVLATYLISSGFLADKFLTYTEQVGYKTHKIDLVLLGISFFMVYLVPKVKRSENYCLYFKFFILIAIMLTMLGSLFETANRLAYYFTFPAFAILPLVSKYSKHNYPLIIILVTTIVFWMYGAITSDMDGTIPYELMYDIL